MSDAEIISITSEARRVRAPAFWCARQWRVGHRSGEVAQQAVILAEVGEDVVREVCANTEAHGGFLAYFDRRPVSPPAAA